MTPNCGRCTDTSGGVRTWPFPNHTAQCCFREPTSTACWNSKESQIAKMQSSTWDWFPCFSAWKKKMRDPKRIEIQESTDPLNVVNATLWWFFEISFGRILQVFRRILPVFRRILPDTHFNNMWKVTLQFLFGPWNLIQHNFKNVYMWELLASNSVQD